MGKCSKNYIGLITDFGRKGSHYVASMKGAILKINPYVNIIDISHEIKPFSTIEASYILKATLNYLPEETILIIVVDPGVGSSRRIVGLKTISNHFLIGPDNGIFGDITNFTEILESIHVKNEDYYLKPTSNTFHGRDIMAPIAAYLSVDNKLSDFGDNFSINTLERIPNLKEVSIHLNEITCSIQYIDNFGNAITNILMKNHKSINDLKEGNQIFIKHKEIELKGYFTTHFNKYPIGSLLFIKGSTGFLEISVNQGSAKEIMKFNSGDIIKIKI